MGTQKHIIFNSKGVVMNDQIKDMTMFSVSDQAAERIAKIMETETGTYFRISVLGGGCSGFQYKFSIDADKMDDDIVLNNTISTGATVTTLIDSMSLELIAGGQLEFVNELAGQYFQVVNPNATAACGCGTSFAL
jgi:iron-sulfur cluster assembly accessory protein